VREPPIFHRVIALGNGPRQA